MATFESIIQLVSVFDVVDSDGTVIERDVLASYEIGPGQQLVFSKEVPTFHVMPYLEVFQAIIDKIREVDSKV